MPRVLILYASVGTGHKSAAESLGEAFRRKQDGEVRVEDAFDYGSSLFREAYTRAYLQMSDKAPMLYKLFYESIDVTDPELAAASNRLRGIIERPLVSKLEQLVDKFAPDTIIGTHPLPIEVLLQRKLSGKIRGPMYTVITDFVAQSTWIMSGIDGYFLASDLTRDELLTRGVPATNLHVTGIPVNLEIDEPKPLEAMRGRLGLPVGLPVITLFGGGLDPKRVRLMVTRLLASEMPGILAVVAGRSEMVTDALSDLGDGPLMRFLLHGRIDYVDDLVAASDLVITKAGGLIVSEILARGTPMLLIDPIPGQEEWNADYVVSVGAGVQVRMPESVPRTTFNLLAQPGRLAAIRERAARAGRPRAALDIAEYILDELRSGAYA